MIGDLVKRMVNLVVFALAAVAFFCVPIGNKTLFKHVCAIFSTAEAAELGRDLQKTGGQVVDDVKQSVPAKSVASSLGH